MIARGSSALDGVRNRTDGVRNRKNITKKYKMDVFIYGFCILFQNVSISKPPTVYLFVIFI
jgi:hypothetical protein